MNSAVHFSKASDNWATPQPLFDELHAEFHFALDAAASAGNTKCLRYLRDGLNWSWRDLVCDDEAVWLNPPYSKCREFIAKAHEEAQKGCTVVCLVPSRTDTKWFHNYVWDSISHLPWPNVEIRFIKGRLKFGEGKNSAPFPSVVIIFRGAR